MPENPFEDWLRLQFTLQVRAFGLDPRALADDPYERAHFMLWNAFAATDEIHEAMGEVGWKPWATSRHVNDAAFIGEIVDALHFIGNLILAAAETSEESVESLAQKVWSEYQNKVEINIQRQKDGYTGLEKCPECKRALDTTAGMKICSEHGVVG